MRRLSISSLAIFIALVAASLLSGATYQTDSLSEVREGSESLISKMEAELKRLPRKTLFDVTSDNKKLIWALAKAGRCDQVMEAIKPNDGSQIELWCFAMALAGRSDEIPAGIEPFRKNRTAMRRSRDDKRTYDQLCSIPSLHGKALKAIVDNDFDSAVETFQDLRKVEKFSSEFHEIAGSLAYEVFRQHGPKDCVDFMERLSEGSEDRFRSLFRNVQMHCYLTQGKVLPQYLLPNHWDAFLWEIYLVCVSNPRGSDDERELLQYAISQLATLDENHAFSLRELLCQSELLEKAERDEYAMACLNYSKSQSSDRKRKMANSLCRWMLRNGKEAELVELVSDLPRDQNFIYLVRRFLESAVVHRPSAITQLIALLPAADQTSCSCSDKLVNVLIRCSKLGLAEEWTAKLKKKTLKRMFEKKLVLHRELESWEQVDLAKAKQRIESLAEGEKKYEIRKVLGTDYLASVAAKTNLKTALTLAESLDIHILDASSPYEAVGEALLNAGQFKEVLKLVDLAGKGQFAWSTSRSLAWSQYSASDNEAYKAKVIEKFPKHIWSQQEKLRPAIRSHNKALALNLVQANLPNIGHYAQSSMFAKAGWADEFIQAAGNVESKLRKQGHGQPRMLPDLLDRTAEAVTMYRGVDAAIQFVEKHVKEPRERIRLYMLCDEYNVNPSITRWTEVMR